MPNCANPECGGGFGDMQGGFDRYNCLECGRQTDLRGDLLPAATEFENPLGYLGGSQQGVRKVEEV